MLHAEAVFDLADVESAEWLFASPVVCTGYPSPEDDFQWRDETFELGAFCRKCGIGAMQKDDFSVSGWKGWKRKKAASLNWLFDVLLVNEGLTEVFRDYDVSFRKVWNGRRSALLKDVVQVEPIHSRDLVWPKGVRELTCKYCGRGKWRMEDFLLDFPKFAFSSGPGSQARLFSPTQPPCGEQPRGGGVYGRLGGGPRVAGCARWGATSSPFARASRPSHPARKRGPVTGTRRGALCERRESRRRVRILVRRAKLGQGEEMT
jgi:hypothetical protein